MPVNYTEQFKQTVIRRYEKGENLKELSKEFGIALSTRYRWRIKYCSIKTPQRTYTPKEFDSMCRQLQKLRHEIEIVCQCGYLSDIPLRKRLEKLESIYMQGSTYSVYVLCEALEVDRGIFYNHIFRRADRTKYEEEQARLMLQVKQVFDDNAQRFGAEKIRAVLENSGIHVSTKRISGIMQELGLRSVRTDVKKSIKSGRNLKREIF